jgi:hypothetical protein
VSNKPSNVIELRTAAPVAHVHAGEPHRGELPREREPTPFAEPADVSAIFAQLVEEDGEVFFGVLAPPVEYAGWVLSPEQAMQLGLLLLERAQRATQKP